MFRGRIKWYGEWRDAAVRHYVVREYMHPKQRVKQEPPTEESIPVLKANVLISFQTGTYPYRQMCSLFFHRETGALVWQYRTGDAIATGPTVVDEKLYVGSIDRRLYAFDLKAE